MTLKEYLNDYASDDTRRIGNELIERELANISSGKVREICRQNLKKIDSGIRDFRF